jgi:hypothetical protein
MATSQRHPGRLNSGRGTNAEPTSPSDQTPATIFGQNTALGGTGLPGSTGRKTTSEPTEANDETVQSFTGHRETHDQTTLAGSTGASASKGGESVTYTDPFAQVGGSANANVTAQLNVSTGTEAANPYGTSTLVGIQGNQPTHTGLGHGRIRGAGKGL